MGKPTLGKLGAVASTVNLKMKFHSLTGKIVTISTNINSAKRYQYLALKGTRHHLQDILEPLPALGQVLLIDVDTHYDPNSSEEEDANDLAKELMKWNKHPKPQGEFIEVPHRDDPTKIVKLGADLPEVVLESLIACLRQNSDLFAWPASEIPGIHLEVACHHLEVKPEARCVDEKCRAQSEEKAEAAAKAVANLLVAGFIKEVKYTTWLSNIVLVMKSNGKWRMCVDFTDLNKACPNDAFQVPNIDKLVDQESAYSEYNQIAMNPPDQEKTAFMISQGKYCYRVMPFGLKNAGATYPRMMNKVFWDQIGRVVEVYLDEMIVKIKVDEKHLADLKEIFAEVRKNNLRFIPEKCTFGVRARKFLGFCLIERGIEPNLDKYRAEPRCGRPQPRKRYKG